MRVGDVRVGDVRVKDEGMWLSDSAPSFSAHPRMFLTLPRKKYYCMLPLLNHLSHAYTVGGREMVHSGCVLWGHVSMVAGLAWQYLVVCCPEPQE